MKQILAVKRWTGWERCLTAALCLALATAAGAQQAAPDTQSNPAQKSQNGNSATLITPKQAHQLFASVDTIMKFASQESGLPIKSSVKRKLTSRAAVMSYLEKKFNNDQDSKRMERDQIVLKKFGLLDRDFALKPFLLALLKEQIEAYYNTKTKTINLLNWVQPDQQKPVLAHELTHALQDQHSDLEKWENQTPENVSTTAAGDQVHLAKDEMDAARSAVAEGQATAVMMDYIMKPLGKSLIKDPGVINIIKNNMSASSNSPVMARAPLLISESMLFPYRDGLSFEQSVWMDQGRTAAFAGTLDRPPSSTWEIMTPQVYEKHLIPPLPLLPNIHPLVDKLYRPYDIGQVGELDVKIMTQLFGGTVSSRYLTPAWDGGLYWAGQLRSAKTPAQQDSMKSLAIFYLSVWKSPGSAAEFAQLYGDNLSNKYSMVKTDKAAQLTASTQDGSVEQDFMTSEGPVLINTRGKMVFIAESFPLKMARQLASLILGAQGAGEMQTAQGTLPTWPFNQPVAGPVPANQIGQPLSASLVHFFSHCGVLKSVVNAEMKTEDELRQRTAQSQ